MLFRIYVILFGGSIGIAMALIARLARTKRYYDPEHLPLEFGSFVAASGFISGALIAFLTTLVAWNTIESTFSRIRFILMVLTFGFLTGFIRGFINPISVSSFDLYKGFLTFNESLDLIGSHLFNGPINASLEAASSFNTGLLGGFIFSAGSLVMWLTLRSKNQIISYMGSFSVMLILSTLMILISSTGPPELLAKLD